MKVFAWNAKRELDTLLTPRDSIKIPQANATNIICCNGSQKW
jgi:hypothetical protein